MAGPRLALDAHHRFIAAAAAGGIAYVLLAHRVHLAARVLLAWDVFAAVAMALAWTVIASRDPYEVRRNARLQDSSSTALFVLIVAGAIVSLFAAGWALRSGRELPAGSKFAHLGLALSAVGLSWALVHTAFTLRYAHHYYTGAQSSPRENVDGGLVFPGKARPDYLDFAYFSFVIGMTCQVSDVQVATRGFRRIALMHGLISFIFNTAILAIFINIVAGML